MARSITQIKSRKVAVEAQITKTQEVADEKISKLNVELVALDTELQDHVAILEAEIALIKGGVIADDTSGDDTEEEQF